MGGRLSFTCITCPCPPIPSPHLRLPLGSRQRVPQDPRHAAARCAIAPGCRALAHQPAQGALQRPRGLPAGGAGARQAARACMAQCSHPPVAQRSPCGAVMGMHGIPSVPGVV